MDHRADSSSHPPAPPPHSQTHPLLKQSQKVTLKSSEVNTEKQVATGATVFQIYEICTDEMHKMSFVYCIFYVQ